jgi:hypothetical protein
MRAFKGWRFSVRREKLLSVSGLSPDGLNRRLGQRGLGRLEDEATHSVLDMRLGIDGMNLPQGLLELLLKVLGVPVLLSELVAEIAPAQLDAFGFPDPAQPVGEPRVDVEGQCRMLEGA